MKMSKPSDWRVLVVDDEDDFQAFMVPILQHAQIEVDTAYSAEDALDKLKSNPPTVAIIDLMLPGMDGFELIEAMKEDPVLSTVPAIAVTAYDTINVFDEALRAGFTAYFPKPIKAVTFVDDLVSVLDQAS
jgi:CheY-like chemotaxis protein